MTTKSRFIRDQDISGGALGTALPMDHFFDYELHAVFWNQHRRINGDGLSNLVPPDVAVRREPTFTVIIPSMVFIAS